MNTPDNANSWWRGIAPGPSAIKVGVPAETLVPDHLTENAKPNLFQKWIIVEQIFFDKTPCQYWEKMGFDFRSSRYGADVPIMITYGRDQEVESPITANIRMLRSMPARNLELGELRLMKSNKDLYPFVRYSTYTLTSNRLVIQNIYAVSVCHLVRT